MPDNDLATRRTVFVTGATGFLGSHFLHAQRDSRLHFILLARAGNDEEAWARVRDALASAFASYRTPFDEAAWRARCTVLAGDICEAACGLRDEQVQWLGEQGIAQFWHFAATLNFEEQNRELIRRQNVEGTQQVIELVRCARIPAFIYCSTAYSVGRAPASKPVPEALHEMPRSFNNYYEESKCLAEHAVRRGCEQAGIAWAILRPSIVIGPRATKATGGTRSGLYGFLGSLYRMRTALRGLDHGLTVNGNPRTRLNLIPVDDLMRDIVHLAHDGFASGTVLHLTSNGYPDIAGALRHVSKLLGIQPLGIRFAGPEQRTPLEQLLDRRTEFHSAYINSEIEFARSLPGQHVVGNLAFAAFVTEAFREFAQESPHDVFKSDWVRAFDGAQLRALRKGDGSRPAIVLVNALGMGVEFWTRFAKQLGKHYDIITWESRGCPGEDLGFDAGEHRFDHHTRDLLAVLDHYGVARAHLVGWCSGAQIALKAARDCPARVAGVAALNGSFGAQRPASTTDFEAKLREVMPRIAHEPRLAEIYYNLVYGNRQASGVDASELDGQRQQASSILASVDPELMHLTSRPFESPVSLYRYATLLTASLSENVQDWLHEVRVPVLVYTGDQDRIAHPDASRWAAGQMPGADLVVDAQGDHFSFYRDETVSHRVDRHFAALNEARGASEVAA